MKKTKEIKVRACQIENIQHPEWGTWGVLEDCGEYYEISGYSGSRLLFKSEFKKFWRVV